MDIDVSLYEYLILAVIAVLTGGAGYQIKSHSAGPAPAPAPAPDQAEFKRLADEVGKLANLQAASIATLNELRSNLEGLDRTTKRLGVDVDHVCDSLELLVSHMGGQIPESAQQSIVRRLSDRRRHEVTAVHRTGT